jgi:hypothetical protein
MGGLLNSAEPACAVCPRCRRKFDFNAPECDSCTTAAFAGGPRVPMQLWRRISRSDGSAQVLPPEAIPSTKGTKWGG